MPYSPLPSIGSVNSIRSPAFAFQSATLPCDASGSSARPSTPCFSTTHVSSRWKTEFAEPRSASGSHRGSFGTITSWNCGSGKSSVPPGRAYQYAVRAYEIGKAGWWCHSSIRKRRLRRYGTSSRMCQRKFTTYPALPGPVSCGWPQ